MNTLSLVRHGWRTLTLILFVSGSLLAQIPTDNPFETKYGITEHWTQELAWTVVKNAEKIPNLLLEDNHVDSMILHQTFKDMAEQGGGVLYFPPGEYHFTYDLTLNSNVILRGAMPIGINDAKNAVYMLPTKFSFPKYKEKMIRNKPDTAYCFRNIANHTAFKGIKLYEQGAENVGLVHLDINRAVIHFESPSQLTMRGEEEPDEQSHLNNIIILGIIQNNAAIPDPAIPTKIQTLKEKAWQRWPLKEGANIRVANVGQGLIANCRLNDQVEDNFRQLGYMVDDGMSFDGAKSMFDYTNHTGISVEMEANNSKSFLIADNYLLVLEGNELLDLSGEITTQNNQTELIHPELKSAIKDGKNAVSNLHNNLYENLDRTIASYFINENQDTLPYRLLVPENYDPNKSYPLVLFLHGMGERGVNNVDQLRHYVWQLATEENREKYPCFVLIPQHKDDEISFTGNVEDVNYWIMEAVVNLMGELAVEYNIDESRRYLIGISSGGWAVWESIIRYPNTFAAAASIASYKRFNEWSKSDRRKEIRRAKKTPLWVFHGKMDEWIPSVFPRVAVSELTQKGGNPKYTEFKDLGHLCWDELYTHPEFLPWLFSHHKK